LTAESNSNNLLPSQILEDILMELQEKVIKLVSEATKMDAANISLNTSFVDDLNLDSLDMVELMMKMEDEFGVEIPEDETENLKSIGDVVTYLKTKSH
jgi:acyl carrier protein